MGYSEMLSALRDERDRIEDAIRALEQLARGQKRRGRPPKSLSRDLSSPSGGYKSMTAGMQSSH